MSDRMLLFLPGFMTAPAAYDELLAPVVLAGWEVVVPQLYPRGLAALLGRHAVTEEASAAAAMVRDTCVIAGHSRGGQAAWLAAGRSRVAGVILIDPVDGEGRRPAGPISTAHSAEFDADCLIIGAGVSGPCAPVPVNYTQFVAATPTAQEVVVEDLGHADILCGRARAVGRRLCRGGPDPDRARHEVSRLIVDFLSRVPTDTPPPEGR